MSARRVCVVDCGRARWKCHVFEVQPGSVVCTSSDQFEVGSDLSSHAIALVGDQSRRWIDSQEVDSVVAVGAEAFRQTPSLIVAAERALGTRIRVLSATEEGSLFAEAVSELCSPLHSSLAIDIGGGSVQFVEFGPPRVIGSAELGTHAIEDRWGLVQGSSESAYLAVMAEVKPLISARIGSRRVTEVIAGSNAYASFFEGIASLDPGHERKARPWHPVSESLSSLEISKAFAHFQRLPRESFKSVMPSNPGFMFGAEKALLVLLVTMDVVGATVARGTDVGIAHGLALRAAHLAGE